MVCPDPGDAGFTREFDRDLGGPRHHQMTHAVIAIDESRGGRGAFHLDIGRRINAARLDAQDILRQAENAVRVGARQIRFGHQVRDFRRVRLRQPDFDECVPNKRLDRLAGNQTRGCSIDGLRAHAAPAFACSADTLRVSPVSTSVRVASTDA